MHYNLQKQIVYQFLQLQKLKRVGTIYYTLANVLLEDIRQLRNVVLVLRSSHFFADLRKALWFAVSVLRLIQIFYCVNYRNLLQSLSFAFPILSIIFRYVSIKLHLCQKSDIQLQLFYSFVETICLYIKSNSHHL